MSETEQTAAGELGVQFSLYPLRQAHLRPAIEGAVRAATSEGLTASVGRLSTFATGGEDAVFRGIRAAFDAARSQGPTVMVVTLSSGLPSDETVAGIQGAVTSSPLP
jgi:YKOF-related Family